MIPPEIVVGIGASAGGLEALEVVFAEMPAESEVDLTGDSRARIESPEIDHVSAFDVANARIQLPYGLAVQFCERAAHPSLVILALSTAFSFCIPGSLSKQSIDSGL